MAQEQVSKKKISLVNLLINYANTFFLILNGLVLVPIYFNYFSLGTYGSYLSAANIAGILALLEFGISLVFTQKLSVFHSKRDHESFSKLLANGLFVSFILVSILIVITLVIMPIVPIWVKAETVDYKAIKHAFLLTSLGLGLNVYSNALTAVFQAWLKVQLPGIVNVGSAVLGILATLFGLFYGFGVVSISFGIFVKGFLSVVILLPAVFIQHRKSNYHQLKLELPIMKDLVRNALPVFGNTVSKSLIDNGQLLIITTAINPAASAIFALTSKIYQVVSTILAPIGSSVYASLSQLVGENDDVKLKINMLKVFSLFSLFATLILVGSFALNAGFVRLWVGPEKFGGTILSLILCVNVFVNSRFVYINYNLFALGIFGKTVLYDQLGAIFRLVLIFTLIKYIGLIAIPASELISISIFSGYFVNRLFIKKAKFNAIERNKVLLNCIPEFLFLIVAALVYQYFFPVISSWFSFIIRGSLSLLFIIMVLLLFNKDARQILNFKKGQKLAFK